MADCIKCGAEIQVGAAKCEYCGSSVNMPKETAAETAASPARETGPSSPPVLLPRFKRVSVGLMLLFALITLGIYISAWFFSRRKKFAELSPKAKNAGPVFGVLLCVNVIYVLAYLGFIGDQGGGLGGIAEVLMYVYLGVLIYSSYITHAAIADFAATQARGVNFAGSLVLAILFNALYIQSKINKMLDARVIDAAF